MVTHAASLRPDEYNHRAVLAQLLQLQPVETVNL
jgi:hypothetical protein